jgi:hypothetical protein
MTTAHLASPSSELMQMWRRQIGHRHQIAAQRGPRPFAIVSYLVRGSRAADYDVDLRRLTLVALFDERLESGELVTRFVGVGGSLAPGGLCFGGPELCRFDKNLRLAPAGGGRGQRPDTSDVGLLAPALQLERYLERCARHPFIPRRRAPSLPVLALIDDQNGSVRVDLQSLPKRQVIALHDPERNLCGRSGTTAFDFYHTGFRIAR